MDEALLQNRDYVIIVAKTNAISIPTPPGYEKRWQAAYSSILSLAQTCETFDPDGITVYVSAREQPDLFQRYKQVKPDQLVQVFDAHYPPDDLNLLHVLQSTLDDYFARKAAQQTKPNGEIVIVLIDGEPRDRLAISRLIVHATQKLDRNDEFGIGFIQLGDDLIARGFLNALDENLKSAGAKFDIVHTEVLEEVKTHSLTEFLLKVLAH